MKELCSIIEAWAEATKHGQPAALATVIAVRGSTYRRSGARMLVTRVGQVAGSISGGCLENDVIERAQTVLATGEPDLVTYDTIAGDDDEWGLGLGCNGVVHVLIERCAPDSRCSRSIAFLEECLRQRASAALATVFRVDGQASIQIGSRLMLHQNGMSTGELADSELAARVLQDTQDALHEKQSATHSYSLSAGSAAVFIEVIQPPVLLMIFGAGHDAVPVVRLGKELGWHVTVVDNRPAYAAQERFPEADVILLARPEEVDAQILDSNTVAVIMTHNYAHDLALLRRLLPSAVRYIGLLGPQSRAGQLLRALANAGVTFTKETLQRLYAPVGIDIGADTPEEVALAIIAEIQAVLANRTGGLLRDRSDPIHDRPLEGGLPAII